MSLFKIDSVYLYTSGTDSTKEELDAKKTLQAAKVSFTELAYNDTAQIPAVLSALNTWSWGEEKNQTVFTKFPIITWKEYYTDLHPMDFNVTNNNDLKTSSLIKNSKLVA